MQSIKKETSYCEKTLATTPSLSSLLPSHQNTSSILQNHIIGQSKEIKQVLKLIERVASVNSTILITGQTGTGKELVARRIHYLSARSNKPLVCVNCGAIPSDVLESELFGHVKGAFTGAITNRKGRFEMAHGGSIFLDEIGDMSCHLQVKLLRVLQEKAFEPVGSDKTMQVDVRIITATNRNLEKAVAEGRFREDLFYRLHVIPVHIPALKERRYDIPCLIYHFIEKFNQSKQNKIEDVSKEAMQLLYWHSWPGNVRELENLIERLVLLKDGGGIIEVNDLPAQYQGTYPTKKNIPPHVYDLSQGIDLNSVMNEYENSLILKALEKTGWNRNQAALLLNINRTTLVEKMKKKGLKA